MHKLWGDQAVASHDWNSARELFFLRCRSRNLSEHSLLWYKNILTGFFRFLEAAGGPSPRETTPNHIRAFLDHLRQRGISSITIDRTYGGIRCLFRYMAQERIIPQNPVSLVEKPPRSTSATAATLSVFRRF